MASFYQTIPTPDSPVCCPYDKTHVVAYKRLQYHLMKCRKNHPSKKMATCHFNARHIVPDAELRLHLASCPDSHVVEVHREFDQNVTSVKGNLDVPTYFPDVHFETEENWDDEPAPRRYGVPPREMAGLNYIKNMTGFKPAEKKQYYENLRRNDLEANIALMECQGSDGSSGAGGASEDIQESQVVGNPPVALAASSSFSLHQQQGSFGGRSRGRGQPFAASNAVAQKPGVSLPEYDPVEVPKLIRKTKKKLLQIENLIDKQQNGHTLNDDEKIKVSRKLNLQALLANLEKMSI